MKIYGTLIKRIKRISADQLNQPNQRSIFKFGKMKINIQPVLENETVYLKPLIQDDFEELYTLASDPLVWEQHPNRDRYKREVFMNYFDGAMKSGGAFKVMENATGKAIGCTRFYDYDEKQKSIFIGYTFYGRDYWGKGFNPKVKQLMLDYIFQFVDTVYFHIGAGNKRSQVAIERLGAMKLREINVAYFGEEEKLNFEYSINKNAWGKTNY